MTLTNEQIIDQLRRDSRFMSCVTEWKVLPAQKAEYSDFPAFSSDLTDALKGLGINHLYSHQSKAIEKSLNGENTVIVTPTASGKTLCYNIPVLHAVLQTKEARALYLFPTKALAQDQMHELHSTIELLKDSIDFDIKSYTFDGDTPVAARKSIKSAGHIVLTNPDMLHSGILPHHTQWVKLFENLQYIVIDEIHHYRGVFGSHLANVIRRLKRVCRFYGSTPQFICCSATIANPKELAEHVTGESMTLIDKNGAPRGKKHFVLYNPPVVNRELGIRKSYLKSTKDIAIRFLPNLVQTIVFARSRMNVEILLTYLKEGMKRAHKSSHLIRGYRGGYLPLKRREIERGLREKEIIGVVSTNALELGIDIGQLQICIIAGYPGTIASTLQQSGRAGRRSSSSLSIIIASSSPLDQYIINHPDYFFEKTPEAGIVDPDNLAILLSHIKCAAFELPFRDDERFGSNLLNKGGLDSTQEILQYLSEQRVLHPAEGKWHWMAETYPAESVSLRSAAEENVIIIDQTNPQEKVIGEIDLFAAQLMVHDEAIYLHEAQQFYVDKLDWDRRKAYVHSVSVDHYTDAQLKSDIKVTQIIEEKSISDSKLAFGEVVVSSVATMYKKIKFNTHENIGWGKIHLPELELHTMAFWYGFPENIIDLLNMDSQEFADGLKAVANVMKQVAPIYIMGDKRDFSSAPMIKSTFADRPTLFLWEQYPGGVGFSHKLFNIYQSIAESCIQLVTECVCSQGCPSCVGPVLEVGDKGKKSALLILQFIVEN